MPVVFRSIFVPTDASVFPHVLSPAACSPLAIWLTVGWFCSHFYVFSSYLTSCFTNCLTVACYLRRAVNSVITSKINRLIYVCMYIYIYIYIVYVKSRDSVGQVGMDWTRLRAGWSGVRISAVGSVLSLLQNAPTCQFGAHSASYTVGTRFLSSE